MAEEKRGGYGSKWMKWAAIYLVAGGIVYLIVYLLFFNHGGSGGGSGYVMLPVMALVDRFNTRWAQRPRMSSRT
jgi:hypothetical protein